MWISFDICGLTEFTEFVANRTICIKSKMRIEDPEANKAKKKHSATVTRRITPTNAS